MDDVPANTNHAPAPPRRVLTLASYAHRRGPLVPAPALVFDVRALPNPPKRLRDAYLGTDKPLRTAFIADPACSDRVAHIHTVVDDLLRHVAEHDDAHIFVGVCCEMGRHRSVACVEEVARAAWPPDWAIEVIHRDLSRHRSEKDKEKRPRKVETLDESD